MSRVGRLGAAHGGAEKQGGAKQSEAGRGGAGRGVAGRGRAERTGRDGATQGGTTRGGAAMRPEYKSSIRPPEHCGQPSWTSQDKQTCRIPNPDIPRVGRVGAPGGTAERGRAGLGANRLVRPRNTSPVYLPPKGSQKTSLERFSKSTNKRNPV